MKKHFKIFWLVLALFGATCALGEIREIQRIDEVEAAIVPGTWPLICFDNDSVLKRKSVDWGEELRHLIKLDDYTKRHGSELPPEINFFCQREVGNYCDHSVLKRIHEETTLVRKLQDQDFLTMAIVDAWNCGYVAPEFDFNRDRFQDCHICLGEASADFRNGVLYAHYKASAIYVFLDKMNKDVRPPENWVQHFICVSADRELLATLERMLTPEFGIEFIGLYYTYETNANTYDELTLAREFDELVSRAKETAALNGASKSELKTNGDQQTDR